MNDLAQHSFRTKTGTCTISPSQIILERDGARGTVAQQIYGDSYGRAVVINAAGGLVAISLAFAMFAWIENAWLGGIVMMSLGVFLVSRGTMLLIQSLKYSAAPVIDRSTIRSVEAQAPTPTSRGYFTVLFEEKGRLRKRLILLPGSLEHGDEEYERAEAVMRAAGLISAI